MNYSWLYWSQYIKPYYFGPFLAVVKCYHTCFWSQHHRVFTFLHFFKIVFQLWELYLCCNWRIVAFYIDATLKFHFILLQQSTNHQLWEENPCYIWEDWCFLHWKNFEIELVLQHLVFWIFHRAILGFPWVGSPIKNLIHLD